MHRVVFLLENCGITLFTFHLSRNTRHKGTRRNIPRDDSSSCNERALPNGDTIQDDGSNADQTTVFKRRAVDDCAMANRDISTDQHWGTWIAMQHSSILNIASLTDHDGGHVPSGNGRRPETCTCSNFNIAHHHCTFCDPGVGVNSWRAGDQQIWSGRIAHLFTSQS